MDTSVHSSCDHVLEGCSAPVRPLNSRHQWRAGEQAQYDSLAARGRSAYDALRWWDGHSHQEAFTLALGAHGHHRVFLMRDEFLASYRADLERVHPEYSPARVDELVERYGRSL